MRTAVILLAATVVGSPAYAQQASQPEFRSFGYARLGYGGAFADKVRSAPAIGFGYRGEFDTHAVDVSFFNYMIRTPAYVDTEHVFTGSLLKLQVLRFLNADADRSTYVGGGISWGGVSVGRGGSANSYSGSWSGSGLQGEFTTGYEFRGTTPLRVFVQADIGVPFFRATSNTYSYLRPTPGMLDPVTSDRRVIPSAVLSLGMGWNTGKRVRRHAPIEGCPTNVAAPGRCKRRIL